MSQGLVRLGRPYLICTYPISPNAQRFSNASLVILTLVEIALIGTQTMNHPRADTRYPSVKTISSSSPYVRELCYGDKSVYSLVPPSFSSELGLVPFVGLSRRQRMSGKGKVGRL